MDNTFIQEKLLPRLIFNPGLAFEQPGPNDKLFSLISVISQTLHFYRYRIYLLPALELPTSRNDIQRKM